MELLENRVETALYGQRKLKRGYCRRCRGYAFVIDGIFQCCDKKVEIARITRSYKITDVGDRRRQPSIYEQRNILKIQDNRCLYCGKLFGTVYHYKKKIRKTVIHYDHLVPYSYQLANKGFVAACNICNEIKSNLMFETVQDAYKYINYKRLRKGYTFYEDF